jgi:murein DD-endopeptidase MepM/ murein hydrolase activator NlpD
MQLSADEIYQCAVEAGFTPDQAVTFTAIALAESGGETGAHNTTGEDSRGLWQINVGPGVRPNVWGDLSDPHIAARAAYDVSGGGVNFSPWTVTHDHNAGTNHDYRQFADVARAASQGAGQGNFAGVEGYGHMPRDASEAGSLPEQSGGPEGGQLAAFGAGPDADHDHHLPPPDGHYRPVSDAEFRDSYGDDRGDHAHQGVDIGAPLGTPLHAITSGTVRIGWDTGGGQHIYIDGEDGRQYYYAHLVEGSSESLGLRTGAHVVAGQEIGAVGLTGHTTGPHLHLEIWENGEHINPYPFVAALPDPEDALVAPGGNGSAQIPAGPDADGDGLPDDWEVAHGTDPNVADSDHDGLTDGFETRHGSDATQVDADHDGLSDAEELLELHSDPTKADTDSDGMDDGLEVATGRDALHGVAAAGNGAAKGLVPVAGGQPGDPAADSDQDGLTDPFEASIGSDPNQADSDHDGLDDGLEHAFGTSALDADSDHDGISDHYETTHGMDPLEALDDPFDSPDRLPGMVDDDALNPMFDDHPTHAGHGDGDLTDPDNDDRPAHVG